MHRNVCLDVIYIGVCTRYATSVYSLLTLHSHKQNGFRKNVTISE